MKTEIGFMLCSLVLMIFAFFQVYFNWRLIGFGVESSIVFVNLNVYLIGGIFSMCIFVSATYRVVKVSRENMM
jgi:hypothetical protein